MPLLDCFGMMMDDYISNNTSYIPGVLQQTGNRSHFITNCIFLLILYKGDQSIKSLMINHMLHKEEWTMFSNILHFEFQEHISNKHVNESNSNL